jgi:G:T-mismatch repair DNA endonuclease (very short patch repair protein)
MGWNVIVIWECMLKGSESDKILNALEKNVKHNIS